MKGTPGYRPALRLGSSAPKRTAGSKATADYENRTEDPQGIDKPTATFMFVTPRKWTRKKKWATERSKEGVWSDVRALNADDLVAWLGQAPAVATLVCSSHRQAPRYRIYPSG